jgi:hypothetical protein
MRPASPARAPAYAACARKTFHSALCHLLQTEFPSTFGPAVTRLFADKVNELYERCHPPLSRVKVGQVLWLAVAADERPGRSKRIENTRLVPVLLELVTPEDIDAACATSKQRETRRAKIIRLFNQAFQQRAVLTEADVGLLLHLSERTISEEVVAHEQATSQSVPRRGTIHDMGRSVTHKAIICYKRLVEKKSTSAVAQETYHSPEDVERYVQCFRRVQLCHDNGMSPEDIAQATGHTLFLVREYLDLIRQLALPPLPDAPRKDGVPPTPRV